MKMHPCLPIHTRRIVLAFSAIAALCTSLTAMAETMSLGRLAGGSNITFTRTGSGEWGVEIAGGVVPRIAQPRPAMIEVYPRADNDIGEFSAGYKTVRRTATGIDATADVPAGEGVVFHVHDVWSVVNGVLSVRREVKVQGNASGGFESALDFSLDRAVGWPDINFMAPGAIYADPTYDGDRSPGGTLTYNARRLVLREDILAAPLFALSFQNGASIAMLDPHPRGDSTEEETKLTKLVMTDAKIQFGAMGAWQAEDGQVHLGFRYPSTSTDFGGGRPAGAAPVTQDTKASTAPAPPVTSAVPPPMRWIRRYHPITDGFSHSYEVRFRFGQDESFRDVTRDAWRWAWDTLNPPILDLDVDLTRRVLLDHLEASAMTIDGRTGMPFVLNTMQEMTQWNRTMIAMGFVGKNLECADQLLQEGDRDHTERGQKMRATGLAMIDTNIKALHSIPLEATGFDLRTGQPWDHIWVAPWLRNATEDMTTLMHAYQREQALGRQHPEWLAWVKSYSDWLVEQQRPDGSYPRRWKPGTNEIMEPTGTSGYNVVPLFVLMTQITGDQKYQAAAIRAAEYVWSTWGTRGLFIGGASDNPNITDKEAGMLSLEAYLALYDATKDPKWLDRAKAAGNFAESWIWIWNLPMAADADNAQLHWKKGVPTVGLQDITAANTGSTDEYLDWAVPSYARLYKDTGDAHYLAVARVLLKDTKSMVALPGRQYDMRGIGWQQENFRLGPGPNGRGVGSHRHWLPWVSANHLHGIVGLDDYDPALYKQLSANPAAKSAAKE